MSLDPAAPAPDPARMTDFPKSRIRLILAPGVALGPGKADLLEGIRDTGSIRAAGNRQSMSYKRAWNLVGEMNRIFRTPLVETEKGGSKGGGARLTEAGEAVLSHFRGMERVLREAAAADIAALQAMVEPGAATLRTRDSDSALEDPKDGV